MGIKSFFQELKVKASPSRFFKALIHQSPEVLPKVIPIKSIDIVEGHGIAPGCVYVTNLPDDSPYKYFKTRIDAVDSDNYVCKFTTVEGDALGDKIEKVSYELKLEATEDGGCVAKLKSDYHTKGDHELSDDEVKAAQEHALGLYKACDDYLCANPQVCA